MKKFVCLVISVFSTFGAVLFAQSQQTSPEEEAKKLQEFIDNEISKMEMSLKLEDWQVYYVDSILNNDYKAMQEDIKALRDAKVTNPELYTQAGDKWNGNIYNALHKVLNEDQWKKYLKSGAAKGKKARDKREAKTNEK